MSELQGKDLAIEVAKKSGYGFLADTFKHEYNQYITETHAEYRNKYLRDKAAEILFSDGMAGKINKHFVFKSGMLNDDVVDWWGSVSPEKILNVWLQL